MESEPPSHEDLMLGIDVGGTDVKLGLVDSRGNIRLTHRTSTPPLGTPQRVFEYAVEFAHREMQAFHTCHLRGVGLAVPGVLDSHEFVLREVVNLPGWLNVPLRQVLSDISELPSTVVNDAAPSEKSRSRGRSAIRVSDNRIVPMRKRCQRTSDGHRRICAGRGGNGR